MPVRRKTAPARRGFEASLQIVRGFASDRLGPTFFPRVLAVALAVLAGALIVRSVSRRSDPDALPPMRAGAFFTLLAISFAYVLLLPTLGFLIATPVLLGAVIRLMGLRAWGPLIGTALGTTVALYLVFGRALHVLLPLGPLAK